MHKVEVNTREVLYLDSLKEKELRDALSKSNVTIKSNVKGIITLKQRIECNDLSNVIIDLNNVEIRGWSLNFESCSNILIKNLIIRTTDKEIRKYYKNKRPSSSTGLDCLGINKCNEMLIQNCSFWSSCDEIVSVVKSNNIFFEECFLAFPLSDPNTHPYGKEHAECSNNSANNLVCYFRCVFAYYRMRGPMFETNDTSKNQLVKMQACNCIMYAFTQAGVKYHSWSSNNSNFQFQFINNLFVLPKNSSKKGYPIVCDDKMKVKLNKVDVCVKNNKLYNLSSLEDVNVTTSKGKKLDKERQEQITNNILFECECHKHITTDNMFEEILNKCGVNDELDIKAKKVIREGKKWKLFKTFDDVIKFIE